MNGVVSDVPNNSGLQVALHPLALLNISDHYTRTKAQRTGADGQPYVVGALLGTQKGREVDICNTYELLVRTEDGITVDTNYFVTKQEQFKQVFPHYDFLGWYSTTSTLSAREIDIHKQLLHWNESPLYLQLRPSELSTSKSLPITIFESIVDVVDGEATTLFVQSKYQIDTGEAERIAVEHVAHNKENEDGEGSSLVAHLKNQRNAIKMLDTRVALVRDYLNDVKSGTVPSDHTILRQIASLCNRIPAACDSSDFRNELVTEYNDVLLTSYLAMITKGTSDMNTLIDKVNVTQNITPARGTSLHNL